MNAYRGELGVFARRMGVLVAALAALVALGTLGFVATTGESPWLAFNRSLDVIATTGSIPATEDTGALIVKAVLTLLGVGALFYTLVTLAEFFVAGHVGQLLADRRAARMLDDLSDHHIVCGYGRVGHQVARDLRAAGAVYVVIEPDPDQAQTARGLDGAHVIQGDGSDDDTLREAGIARARALVACVDSDAENVFITLTARELREDLVIVARAAVDGSEAKLRRAGADRVISPYKASGAEMARLALHPQSSAAVELSGGNYRVGEIAVADGSPAAGTALADLRGGAIVAALERDGRFEFQPAGSTVLRPGDVVVAMGTPGTIARLEQLLT